MADTKALRAVLCELIDHFGDEDLTIMQMRERLLWEDLEYRVRYGVAEGIDPEVIFDMLVSLNRFVPEVVALTPSEA